MKFSDYVAAFLKKEGVNIVFGYQGGAITHLVDSLYKAENIQFVNMGNEQGAAFAAEGYARTRGDIGVAMATSGPGATNLITGIGSAYFDSVPMLYITGQVNTYEYKSSFQETSAIRQLGFQETDIVSIVKPITKYAKRITQEDHLIYELSKAVTIARSGRQGPVLIDIPMDIQRLEMDENEQFERYQEAEEKCPDLSEVVTHLKQAKRPIILIGGGFRAGENEKELFGSFLKRTKIPVVSSLMGLEHINFKYKNYLGLIGAYGNRFANITLANSDLIVALGSRLDNRQTAKRQDFAKNAKLVRVDVDGSESNYKVKEDEIFLKTDVNSFLQKFSPLAQEVPHICENWQNAIDNLKSKYPETDNSFEKLPSRVIKKILECVSEDTIMSVDVGQNQIWTAQSLLTSNLHKFLVSGGMGAMGFSLPAAIGACFAKPDKKVISLNGDGGVMMNIQELQIIKRYHLPIKVIVLNNHALGMIRHFQEMYFESNFAFTTENGGYDAPDFASVAKAFKIEGFHFDEHVTKEEITQLLSKTEGVVIDISLPSTTYVFPKLSVGKPIENQDPLLPEEEFNENTALFKNEG